MDGVQIVSIIVNNYNYGRFLGDTIDSALAQSYPRVQVIVVDDGSTDDSRDVIRRYGERIVPVLKENGGQASAFNAGFAASEGEIIIFLDADDVLMPEIAERVAAVYRASPGTAKIQYRLEIIDAAGEPTGGTIPRPNATMPSGDLRQAALVFPDDIPCQPTSGNAFAAWMLHRIFPMPEQEYRVSADNYPNILSMLFGPVISLDVIGGRYRSHGENTFLSNSYLARSRRNIVISARTHQYIAQFAALLGLPSPGSGSHSMHSVTFIANRIVSLKLDRAQHPLAGDRLFLLSGYGIRSVMRHSDFPWMKKLLYLLWFAAMLPAPKPVAHWLEQELFHTGRSKFASKLIATKSKPMSAALAPTLERKKSW